VSGASRLSQQPEIMYADEEESDDDSQNPWMGGGGVILRDE